MFTQKGFLFYQRCGGLLHIQNQLPYVASVMNSLHCLFHLRTTHSDYFQAIKLPQKALIRSSLLWDIWKMIWCALQLFLFVVILVTKNQKHFCSTCCFMIPCRRYQKDFIQQTSSGLNRTLHDITHSKHSFPRNEHQPNEGFTSGKQQYDSSFCVQHFHLHWIMLA